MLTRRLRTQRDATSIKAPPSRVKCYQVSMEKAQSLQVSTAVSSTHLTALKWASRETKMTSICCYETQESSSRGAHRPKNKTKRILH